MTGHARFAVAALAVVLTLGCSREKKPETASTETPAETAADVDAEQAALHKADASGTYGGGVHLKKSVPISEILANPADYEGKIVQVSGTVEAVCPRRGCWMDLAGDQAGETLRVKVADGEIVFPLSAKGNHAVVEGVVEKIELTEEQHRAWKEHEAQERGETFDPATIEGPLTSWRIHGLGARIES